MPLFTDVVIIYNPASTGAGETSAKALKAKLAHAQPKLPVELLETERPQHAIELADRAARKSKYVLVISASGDGGYHEVVMGVMRARQAGHDATAGLIPAGNANDHWHNVGQGDIVEQISHGRRSWIDLLELQADGAHGKQVRFAHSYAGIGLTSSIGRELNRHHLTRWNEGWIVLRSLLRVRPVTVVVGHKRNHYDSLIFSNVGQMSKYFHVAPSATATDGLFEVTAFRTKSKLALIWVLAQAMAGRLPEPERHDRFRFTTIRETAIQLDGEVMMIPADTTVTVTIAPRALPCVL